MDTVWAYARAVGSATEVSATLPHLAGARGLRLKLTREAEPIGPPAGSVRYRGTWQDGRLRGEADVTLIPFAAWGTEIHIALSSRGRLAGRLFSAHLRRCAEELANSIASSVAHKTTGSRRAAPAREAPMKRWLFAPATRSAR